MWCIGCASVGSDAGGRSGEFARGDCTLRGEVGDVYVTQSCSQVISGCRGPCRSCGGGRAYEDAVGARGGAAAIVGGSRTRNRVIPFSDIVERTRGAGKSLGRRVAAFARGSSAPI